MKRGNKESRMKAQRVVSAHQAARLLGMDRHDVRHLLQQAKIRGHKAQEQWEIPFSEIRRRARFRTQLRSRNSLTPAQVARELAISRQAVHQKIREGRLRSRRVGRRRLVPRSALEEELRKREHKGLWDLNRVSRELGITRQQIYPLLLSGRLKARKIGYYYFVRVDEVRIFKKALEC